MFEKVVPLTAIIVTAVVVMFITITLVPRLDRVLTIRAVEACGNISKFAQQDSSKGFTAQYPVSDVYQNCLKETK